MNASTDKSVAPETIVLIHGLWMTPLSWEHWASRFIGRGHRVLAPAWPGMDGDIERLRRDPSGLANLGIGDIVEHYEKVIRGLDRPPIIMGHSFGGLFTQILLDRGFGAAGVAISSAPVKGILLLPFSTLKVSLPALSNPANLHKVAPLTFEQFRYAFTNDLDETESRKAFERYAVPGPDHVLFQAGLANLNPHAETTVNFRNGERAPLLLIAGGKDHIAPPSLLEMNYRLYKKSPAVTDYKEFPNRTHYVLGQEGWEEVADYALEWALRHAGAGAAARAS